VRRGRAFIGNLEGANPLFVTTDDLHLYKALRVPMVRATATAATIASAPAESQIEDGWQTVMPIRAGFLKEVKEPLAGLGIREMREQEANHVRV
jgi:hypothetical protein